MRRRMQYELVYCNLGRYYEILFNFIEYGSMIRKYCKIVLKYEENKEVYNETNAV
jgi:hypothetical protein